MSRYCGPRIRLIRRLGKLPNLTTKVTKKKRTPGQHGKLLQFKNFRPSLSGDFRERLIEKQKLRYNYGITERQMIRYISEAKRRKGSTENNLIKLLELRLDTVIHRLGFAITLPAARQLVNHGHILVNEKKVKIPSFECKPIDYISVKDNKISRNLVLKNLHLISQLKKTKFKRKNLKFRNLGLKYRHLELLNTEKGKILAKIKALPKRYDIDLKINELKVVEYYSR
jgi:small subunit ribosomal protein S4